jgi:hypothetical protein
VISEVLICETYLHRFKLSLEVKYHLSLVALRLSAPRSWISLRLLLLVILLKVCFTRLRFALLSHVCRVRCCIFSHAAIMKLRFSSYGMTETCGTCTRTLPYDPTCSGTIGPPQPVNEVKLVDVPSMGYTSEDKPNPRGELCLRGVNCFIEYYKGMHVDGAWKAIC